jgi:hypothetical protein
MNTYFITQAVAPTPVITPAKPSQMSLLLRDPLFCAVLGALLSGLVAHYLTKWSQQSKFNKKIEELHMSTTFTNVLIDLKDEILTIKQNMATKDDIKNMATKDDIIEVKDSIQALDKRVESLEQTSLNGFDSITKALFNWNK